MDRARSPVASVLSPALLAFAVGAGVLATSARPEVDSPHEGSSLLRGGFGQLPLYFIENRGQFDPRVSYYVQGAAASLYFTPRGLTMVRTRNGEGPGALRAGSPRGVMRDRGARRWVLRQEFLGAELPLDPIGRDRTPALVSYFTGSPSNWKTRIPTYASVVYKDLWPGIDLQYQGTSASFEYTFVVEPGVDPGSIGLAYRGASRVGLTPDGGLRVSTPPGGFREEKPYAYQEVDGRRVEVLARHGLRPQAGPQAYGFRLGVYDPTKPLVVDPVVPAYAGYIGGEGDDEGNGVTVDASGAAYVTGVTDSSEATFPETVGPDLTSNGGGIQGEAFVAKVNPAGTGLVYAGYIGGAGTDWGEGIAVDSAGAAYVAGFTMSTEATFPETVGPDLTYNGGISDAFVAKVNPAGTGLVYAGYIGGDGYEHGYGIAVDSSGAAYVTGETASTEDTFPETVGPDLTYNGGTDAFVAEVNPAGTGLVYAGYIGGDSLDRGLGVGARAARGAKRSLV